MSAHTQWLIVDDVPNSHIGYRAIVESDGTTVCNPSPMGEDNAQLIAAAPELLAALRLMLREYEALRFEQPERWPIAAAAARAAIAKVECSA